LEKDYNPRIQEALGRTGELLRWDEDYLAQQVEAAWKHYHIKDLGGTIGLSRDVFTEPAAILSRLLRRAAVLVTGEPRGLGFTYVAKIMGSEGKPGWMQDLPGMTVKITDEGIWFNCYAAPMQMLNLAFPEIALDMGRWSEIRSLKLDIGLWEEWNLSSANGTFDRHENKVAVFSRDLLGQFSDQLVCRTRRQGDRMWFQGVGHKSLKKVFQEENISVKVRNGLPLIAFGAEVLWIPGVRQSGLCRPDQNTERVYCVLKPQTSGSNLNSL
jgi:tRNA(Ile)-lysidine synthase